MRTPLKSVLSLLLCLFLIQCKEQTQPILFQGNIQNSNSSEIIISGRGQTIKIPLGTSGEFQKSLELPTGFYKLAVDRHKTRVYLEAGKKTQLNFKIEETDPLFMFADQENKVILQHQDFTKKILSSVTDKYKLEPGDYLQLIDSIAQVQKNHLSQVEVSASFKSLESKEIEYERLLDLVGYEFSHKYKTGKDTVVLPKEFLSAWDKIDLDLEEDYEQHSPYRMIILEHIWKLSNSGNPAIIDHLKTLQSENIRESLLKSHLVYELKPSSEDVEIVYNALMEFSKDSILRAKIEAKYEVIQNLRPGKAAPIFENYENIKGGTTSLSDLTGKFVYIDVWATWCGWCKKEFPYLKDLEHEYQNKNIQFVSVSVDEAKDRQRWIDMVAKEKLGGIQLLAEGDWKSTIIKAYAIDGIPRFILIDPEGNIVEADAPRPSNPDLKKLLQQLL